MTHSRIRLLFMTAALFNWAAVLLFTPATGLPQALGLTPAGNGLFDHIALLAIAGFGCGYWLVSRDPASHRGIVVLGLLLKLGVVAIAIAHALAGSLNARTAMVVSGDLVYAALFWLYLRGAGKSQHITAH